MKTSRFMLTATALVLVAGSAMSAQPASQPREPSRRPQQDRLLQQQDQPQERRATQPSRTEAAARGYQLIPTERALNADVVDAQEQNLGSLEDLVLDAGSGRIVQGIVSHGGVLGIGGKNVAVPWQSFQWDQEQEHFVLGMNRQQLEQAPEFDRSQLSRQGGEGQRGGMGIVRGRQGADEDGWGADGEYQSMIERGQKARIQGTATNISREAPMSGMNEGIIITVETRDQGEMPVHLGPAWFIDRQAVMLRLGDDVQIEGVEAQIDGQRVVVAHSLRSPHGEFRLRHQQGKPVWDTSVGRGDQQQQQRQEQQPDREQPRQQPGQPGQNNPERDNPGLAMAQPGGGGMQQGQPRNQDRLQNQQNQNQQDRDRQPRDAQRGGGGGQQILVSDLDGQTVTTLGEEDLGKVEDIVFDANSGKVAFVVLSAGPLGGDLDNTAIPWEMVRVEPDGRLLASQVDRARLENAPKIEDWDDLDDPQVVSAVYRHFGARNPFEQGAQMQPPGQQQAQPGPRGAAQNQSQQRYIQLFTSGQQASVTGTVQNAQQMAPMQGMESIMVLTVTGQDGTKQKVHLAPQQFLQRSNITLSEGDQVTVQGRKATVEGEEVIIATQVQKNGQSVNLRGPDGKPAWESQQQNQNQNQPQDRQQAPRPPR